jgi:hypothetical protein
MHEALERYANALDPDLRSFIVPRCGLQERTESKARPRRHQMRLRSSPSHKRTAAR